MGCDRLPPVPVVMGCIPLEIEAELSPSFLELLCQAFGYNNQKSNKDIDYTIRG